MNFFDKNAISSQRGFTLIELMVVITVAGILLVGGVAGYGKFNSRQLVINSGKEMLVNLRQAQSKALSNVKTVSGCTSSTLTGYRVAGSGSSYTVSEIYTTNCAGGGSYVVKTMALPNGVTIRNAFSITFRGLSGGATVVGSNPIITFCASGCTSGAQTYNIAVTSAGLIQDNP